MKHTVEEDIDSIIARHPGRFVPMDTSEWTKPFEARLPFRLPPSFTALIRRYRFPTFQCGEVTVLGNVDGTQRGDLVVKVFRDPTLSCVTQRSGFVQIGNPDTLSYDPICFDLRARAKTGEGPLVRLDHEEILISSRIKILERVSPSFLEFLEKLTA